MGVNKQETKEKRSWQRWHKTLQSSNLFPKVPCPWASFSELNLVQTQIQVGYKLWEVIWWPAACRVGSLLGVHQTAQQSVDGISQDVVTSQMPHVKAVEVPSSEETKVKNDVNVGISANTLSVVCAWRDGRSRKNNSVSCLLGEINCLLWWDENSFGRTPCHCSSHYYHPYSEAWGW